MNNLNNAEEWELEAIGQSEELEEKVGELEDEYLMSVQQKFDEYLMATEGRGISYGEIAYLEEISKAELGKIERELDEWLDRKDDNGQA